jgi:26S proteasome regulatory subunit N5
MMQRLKLQLTNEFKTVKVNDAFVTSLNYFTTPEIIKQPFSNQAVLETHPSLSKFVKLNPSIEEHFVNDLKIKTIQHNIRVIAKYYKRIRLARFSELLNLTRDEIEDYLSDLSSEGDIHIKIDRPSGIVTFQQPKQPEEVLSEWSSDVSKMLNLMESTCHLINRENMVYKA